MQYISIFGYVLAASVGVGFGYTLFRLRTIQEEARMQAENALLKTQVDELKSIEALLRLEINDISLSNTRLETLLEESQKNG